MGTGSFTDQNDGEVADAVDVQQLIDAGKGDLVPRNSSGVATANAGDLGTSTYPFKKAHITTGFFCAGMIMPIHDFNGTITPGQGWMKCDGSIINETNYDAIHGAGSWDTFIGSSALDGKYTPNMNNKYLVGVTNTTQTGASALTSVGNASHASSAASHSHSLPNHNHIWYGSTGDSATDDATYDSNSSSSNITATSKTGGEYIQVGSGAGLGLKNDDGNNLYTSIDIGQSNTGLASPAVNVQPESIQVEYWIRII